MASSASVIVAGVRGWQWLQQCSERRWFAYLSSNVTPRDKHFQCKCNGQFQPTFLFVSYGFFQYIWAFLALSIGVEHLWKNVYRVKVNPYLLHILYVSSRRIRHNLAYFSSWECWLFSAGWLRAISIILCIGRVCLLHGWWRPTGNFKLFQMLRPISMLPMRRPIYYAYRA